MATYSSAIPYIQKAEGGLSRAQTDAARRYPSPYTHLGKTGWHTNRGVTFRTFESMAPRVGYSVTKENFINMPDEIWLGIYKKGYWDDMRGNLYDSQPVANAVVDFAWASGGGGARRSLRKHLSTKGVSANDSSSIAKGFNDLVKTQGEEKVFSDLIDHRKGFFKSLNQPANEKGWLNRMDVLKAEGLQLLSTGVEKIKQNPLETAIIVGVMAVALVILVTTFKKDKK